MTSLVGRAACTGFAVVALGIGMNGCVPHVNEETVNVRHPSTTQRSTTETVRHDKPADVSATASENAVKVKVEQRTECETITRTPIEEESGTKRSLKNGTLAQGVNLGLAALLVGGGIAAYSAAGSSSCTKSPDATPQNPNPASRPCTAEEATEQTQTTKGFGILITSSAVIPLGAFVWNIFRAKDKVETTPRAPTEDRTMATCETKPLANVPVTFAVANETLTSTTDANGYASFDLSDLRDHEQVVKARTGTITASGASPVIVNLTNQQLFATWKSEGDAAAAERVSRLVIEKNEAEFRAASRECLAPTTPKSCNSILKWRQNVAKEKEVLAILRQGMPKAMDLIYGQIVLVCQNAPEDCESAVSQYAIALRDPSLATIVVDGAARTKKANALVPAAKQAAARNAQALAAATKKLAGSVDRLNRAIEKMPQQSAPSESAPTNEYGRTPEQQRYMDEQSREIIESSRRADARRECEIKCSWAQSSCQDACPSQNQSHDGHFKCRDSCYASKHTCEAGCVR